MDLPKVNATNILELKNLCRLCGQKCDLLKDLFSVNDNVLLSVEDYLHINVKKYDELPTCICINCEEKIVSFNLFILECTQIQQELQKIYLNLSLHVKIEESQEFEEDLLTIPLLKESEIKQDLPLTDNNDDFQNYESEVNDSHEDDLLEEINIAELKKLKENVVTIEKIKVKKTPDQIDMNSRKIKDYVSLSCHVCNEEFSSWAKLEDHCTTYHDVKPVVVCFCGFEIRSKPKVYKHVSEHRSKNANNDDIANKKISQLVSFDCHICEKKCYSFYSLRSHCKRKHKTTPLIKCFCGAIIKSKSFLYKHIAEHRSNSPIYHCEECTHTTKSHTAMIKHKRSHVPIEERIYKCDTCNKVCQTRELLKSHFKTHIPIEKRKSHECPVCKTKFISRSSLMSHRKVVHDKIKRFICDLCGYACGTAGELKQHKAIHSDDKPYVCTKCSKRFKTYSNLKTHQDTHEDTKYVCYVCSRVLNSRRTLKKHLLVHDSVCRHVCEYCNKAFKRRQTLKVHLAMHTGDKPLSCKWCDERFAYASTLRSHRLRYHPEKMVGGHMPPENYDHYEETSRNENEENLKMENNVLKLEETQVVFNR